MRLALALTAAIAALAVTALVAAQEDDGRRAFLPEPAAAIPREPSALARRLEETHVALRRSIDAWVRGGGAARGGPPRDVTLQALHHQRIYRLLSARPVLAARTLRRLPRGLGRAARDLLAGLRALRRLHHATPLTPGRKLRIGRALPADVLLGHYRRAQRRFGVGWHVLAAVNFVETAFNRLRNDSVSGAQGPMQFIPSTWKAYGLGGDIHEPRDAIMGAANYLRRSGAPRNYARALYAYNPSRLYVRGTLRIARQMRASRRSFYAIYSWQVYVRTPTGERRLTGPGRR